MEKNFSNWSLRFYWAKIYRQLFKLKRNVCGTVRNLNLSNSEYIKVVEIAEK